MSHSTSSSSLNPLKPLSGMMKRKLIEKMSKLTPSMEHITGLSKMMNLNYHKAEATVDLWWQQFQSASPHRYLTFVYVANDIMQNSRKQGQGFINAFTQILGEALCLTVARNPKLLPKIQRLIQVWKERQVMGSATLKTLRTQVTQDLSHISPARVKNITSQSQSQTQVVPSATQPPRSPGTPPGTPPPECVARSRLLLRSVRPNRGFNLAAVLGETHRSDEDEDVDEDVDEEEDEDENRKGRKRKRKRANDSDKESNSDRNGARSTKRTSTEKTRKRGHKDDEDEEDVGGGLVDALVYNDAVEGMMQKLKDQYLEVEPSLLQLRETLPSYLIKGSDVESTLRRKIITNAGVLKQLKYELEQKQERNRSMITMIGHEIEQQKEHITSTESDIQSIDASLHLLNELCQQHPDKKVFNLKRKKERVVEMKKTVSGHVLRDDLQRVDDDDEDGADSKRNAKIAAAQKRKAAKKKKKKKSVPMVWNRALRAYVPINVDGTEMQWREH
jgi:hypothetical protein